MVRGKEHDPSINVEYSRCASDPRLTHASLFRAGCYWPNTAEFFPGKGSRFSREIDLKDPHQSVVTLNEHPVTVVPLHAHLQALIMIEIHPDFKFAAEQNIEKDREDFTSL